MQIPQAVLGVSVDTKDAENDITRLGSSFHRLAHTAYTAFQRVFALFSESLRQVTLSLVDSLNKFQGFVATMQAATGSAKIARESYEFLRQTADQLGVRVDHLTVNYARLRVALKDAADGGDISREVFLGLAQAARTMHLSGEDTRLMFYAVTQMASKGVVSMEELRRQLGEKLPGVMKIAADGLGMNTQELEALVRTGQMQAIPFLRAFGPALQEAFGESAIIAAQSLDAAINRLSNLWMDFTVNVLDSGGANAMIEVIDALREKLGDSQIIQVFSNTVKTLSKTFADFIKELTAQDLERMIEQVAKALEGFGTVIKGLANIFIWVSENADKIAIAWAAIKGAGAANRMMPAGTPVPLRAGGTILGGMLGGYAMSQGIESAFGSDSPGEQMRRSQLTGTNLRKLEMESMAAYDKFLEVEAMRSDARNILDAMGFKTEWMEDEINKFTESTMEYLIRIWKKYAEDPKYANEAIIATNNLIFKGIRSGIPGEEAERLMVENNKKEQERLKREAERLRKQQEATIAQYEARVFRGTDPSIYEQMSYEISEGKYKSFDAESKHQLQILAGKLQEMEIEKEILAIAEKGREFESNRADQLEAEAQALMRAYDPWLDYYDLLKKIDELVKNGNLDPMIGDAIAMNEHDRITKQTTYEFDKQKTLIEQMRDGFRETSSVIADGFGEMIMEGGKFSDVLRQIGLDMLDIAYNALVLKPLTAAMDTMFFGANGQGGLIGNIFSSFHQGGVVGSGSGSRRLVNPMVFASAPRLHNGLGPDEFPAILQRGEQVIPRGQSASNGDMHIEQNIHLTVKSSGNAEEDGQTILQTIVPVMRNVAREVIMHEIRPTGALAR